MTNVRLTPFSIGEGLPSADSFGSSRGALYRRESFYTKTLGPPREPGVYHWEDNHDPHIDVYVHARTRARPYETVITGGMSDRPMPGLLPGSPMPRRVELVLKLSRAEAWAAMVLREIASLPFELGIVLTPGGLIEGSREIRPGSLLRHAMLLPAVEETGLAVFRVQGEAVSFLRPVFLSDEEFQFALEKSPDRMASMLHRAGEALIADPDRSPVLRR